MATDSKRDAFIDKMLDEWSDERIADFLRELMINALSVVFDKDEGVVEFAESVIADGKSVEEIKEFSKKYESGKIAKMQRADYFLRNCLFRISGLRNLEREYLLEQPAEYCEFLERSGLSDRLIASYFEDSD